jgi:hypothetical protein
MSKLSPVPPEQCSPKGPGSAPEAKLDDEIAARARNLRDQDFVLQATRWIGWQVVNDESPIVRDRLDKVHDRQGSHRRRTAEPARRRNRWNALLP